MYFARTCTVQAVLVEERFTTDRLQVVVLLCWEEEGKRYSTIGGLVTKDGVTLGSLLF